MDSNLQLRGTKPFEMLNIIAAYKKVEDFTCFARFIDMCMSWIPLICYNHALILNEVDQPSASN